MSPKLHCRSVSCLSVNVTTVGVRVADNGLGLGEVGEIEAQMFNKPLMLIEVRIFKFSTSAPILPNPC